MWLQQKYIGLVSSRLNRFRRVNNTTYNFRCHVCGDSQKNKAKARGYLYHKEGNFVYHCHNCHTTLGFDKFLNSVDYTIYDEYRKEKLIEKYGRKKTEVEVFAEKMKKPVFVRTTALNDLRKISQLPVNHPAKQYIDSRKIPTSFHSLLFYAPKFKKFVNHVLPGKFTDTKYDEPRLIIPFLNSNKELFGFQGRGFTSTGLRYITIMLDNDRPKVFGLERVDFEKRHYVLEGPIDSMFVNNAIAMAGQSIEYSVCNEHSVFVFDNEPRNPETIKKMQKTLDLGYSIVIFPNDLKQKDINDIVLQTSIDIESLLCNNIYTGLKGQLRLKEWAKV